MPAPRPILKLSDPDPSYAAASALPFTESRGFDNPHVHFPPTPIMTSTAITHSASIYDRAPIVVSQNVCELPERGGRSFIPDLPVSPSNRPNCKRSNTGYFHPSARGSDDSFPSEDIVSSSSSSLLSPRGLNDFYNYHTQLQQGLTMHHRPPPLVLDHGSDSESTLSSSISHISIRHYSACSVPTSRSVSPTHTLSGTSPFVSCPPSPSVTSDKALSARMVGLSLGITSSTTATTMTTTATTSTLMTKEPKRTSRGADRSRERERERDRQDKLERFNGEDNESWSKDCTQEPVPRTSTSKSRRRRLSVCSFQEPALEDCLGGF